MARRTLSKEHLTREEIRERVNRVMDQWQSYPDFAHLFDALLVANDNLGDTEFSRLYNACHPARSVSDTKIHAIREGSYEPSYEFVAALLDHDLLNLGPAPDGGSASECKEKAPHRVALFAAAGLIEVTPESTRQWNREVLAGHQRLMACDHPGPRMTWKQLMHKLVQFQTQGDRTSILGLAPEARALTGDSGLFPNNRLADLLGQCGSVPTEKERHALYRLLDLEQAQVRYLEEAIETGLIPLQPPARTTHFARAFGEVLDTLKAKGISQAQLVERSLDPQTGLYGLSAPALSNWKLGRNNPTLEGLRALVDALRRCHDKSGHGFVTEQVTGLIRAAGFTPEELSATSHDLIARIGEGTRIKSLLAAIRNAADVSAAVPAVPVAPGKPSHASIKCWEAEGRGDYPTGRQVRDLLGLYNEILATRGLPLMTPEEIERVAAVAERDRTRWEAMPRHEKLRPGGYRRQPPSADFGGELER